MSTLENLFCYLTNEDEKSKSSFFTLSLLLNYIYILINIYLHIFCLNCFVMFTYYNHIFFIWIIFITFKLARLLHYLTGEKEDGDRKGREYLRKYLKSKGRCLFSMFAAGGELSSCKVRQRAGTYNLFKLFLLLWLYEDVLKINFLTWRNCFTNQNEL